MDQASPDDVPTYIFEGTWEKFLELKKSGRAILGKNVFLIDPKIIVK
ncbi:MAG: hypothetical protein PHN89_02790 [Candidatus Pacebacteria bacterium]|nr:hypothetical protein [Candidatus Paceibacterota bacterium]